MVDLPRPTDPPRRPRLLLPRHLAELNGRVPNPSGTQSGPGPGGGTLAKTTPKLPLIPARLEVVGHVGAPARCKWRGCDRHATHYPHLALWANGVDPGSAGAHDPIGVVVDLPLCRHHARRPEWLTRKLQYEIAANMHAAGKAAPNFKTAVLGCTSIRDGDHPYSRRPTQ